MAVLKKEIADDKFALKTHLESKTIIWGQKKDNKDKALELKRKKIEEESDNKIKYFDTTIRESNDILFSMEMNDGEDVSDSKLEIILKEQEDKKEILEKQTDNKIEILEKQVQDIIQQLEKQLQDKKNALEKQLEDNIQQLKDKLTIKKESIDSQYNSKIELFKSKVEVKTKTKDSKTTDAIEKKKKYIQQLESQREAAVNNKTIQLELIDNEIQKSIPEDKVKLTLVAKIEAKEKEYERLYPLCEMAYLKEDIDQRDTQIINICNEYDEDIKNELNKGHTKEWDDFSINKLQREKQESINAITYQRNILVKKLESYIT